MKKLLLFILFVFSFSLAQEKAGEVVKKQGRVKLFKEGNPRGELITQLPKELYVKDILKTDFASMAFVKLLGVDKLVLMENSVLYIEGIDKLNFEEGRAVFQIRKRGESKGLKVRVRSVIIGIKGTRFAVDAKGDSIGIFLKDGYITVRNMVGEFIRYKSREEEEYEEFKRGIEEGIKREREEYEKFKEETEREFREFVKEFELKPGGAVIIKGNEVRDVEIPPEVEEEFQLLDMF
ncbi:FecR domain-containing protein [Hydrogenivirga sp.]